MLCAERREDTIFIEINVGIQLILRDGFSVRLQLPHTTQHTLVRLTGPAMRCTALRGSGCDLRAARVGRRDICVAVQGTTSLILIELSSLDIGLTLTRHMTVSDHTHTGHRTTGTHDTRHSTVSGNENRCLHP